MADLKADADEIAITYMVSVYNGFGSGSYTENAIVTICAFAPDSGMVFDRWNTGDDGILADATAAITSFRMPAKAVIVTATYKSVIHKHNLTYHDRVDPTEMSSGNLEYWECTSCKKLFADAGGTDEIAVDKIVIPMLSHNLIHHVEVAPTEEVEGSIEYWECSICKKCFSDADGKTEISAEQIRIDKLINPLKKPIATTSIIKMAEINGIAVSIEARVIYPQAVTWTGSRITKGQLEFLAKEQNVQLATIALNGLVEAMPYVKDSVDSQKLVTIGYNITGEKNVGDKPYFTVTVKLNNKAAKKAKLKKADKVALNKFIRKFNEDLQKEENRHYFEIVPISIADSKTNITIKAAFKNKKLRVNNDNTLKGVRSISIKVRIPGVKKAKTYTYKKGKATKAFNITVTDSDNRKASITPTPLNTGFEGTKSDITIMK